MDEPETPLEVEIRSSRGGSSIKIEGSLHLPAETESTRAAILCHPHLAGGGDRDVPLLRLIADEMASNGVVALRFNFGGVGGSEGIFTDGAQESRDIIAAFQFLGSTGWAGEDRISIVGWSFGALMGLRSLSEGAPASRLVAIAPPLVACDWRELAGEIYGSSTEISYVVGESDQFCPLETLRRFAIEVSSEKPGDVTVVPGADHFLFGSTGKVARLVSDLIAGD